MIGFAILLKNIRRVQKLKKREKKKLHIHIFSPHLEKTQPFLAFEADTVWWESVCVCPGRTCDDLWVTLLNKTNVQRASEHFHTVSYCVFLSLLCRSTSSCLYVCTHGVFAWVWACVCTCVCVCAYAGRISLTAPGCRTPPLSSAAINTSASSTETLRSRTACLQQSEGGRSKSGCQGEVTQAVGQCKMLLFVLLTVAKINCISGLRTGEAGLIALWGLRPSLAVFSPFQLSSAPFYACWSNRFISVLCVFGVTVACRFQRNSRMISRAFGVWV